MSLDIRRTALSGPSGDFDPGVVLYLVQEEGMSANAISDLLYHSCGRWARQASVTTCAPCWPPKIGGRGTRSSGALVRRGEAVAVVTATGAHTKFGRAAELVRTARVVSSQQKAIFRVVRNLAGLNGIITLVLIGYAWFIGLPIAEMLPLVLIAVLASIPVALPATFTLATALGAQALAKQGVLPTRLSAVDEFDGATLWRNLGGGPVTS
jgi:hypothetical protein